MPANVVILGGGVGGTLTANLLAKRLKPGEARIQVVDPTGIHVYQPGFQYVAVGQARAQSLSRDERSLLNRRVELIVDQATYIDAQAKEVSLGHGGSLPYDYLVVATGARLVPEQVPGLIEGAHEFYSLEGSLRLREALRGFKGGRLVIGVAGMPYKCPPAPVEFALLADSFLRKRGVREKTQIDFLSPLNRAFTIESASKMVARIYAKQGINLHTFVNVEAVDPSRGEVSSLEGESFPYDLLVLVPPHRGAEFIEKSGLVDRGGWVPTDRHSLAVRGTDGVFAIGDTTDLPISKSGSTAHYQSPVVVERIAAGVQGVDLARNKGHYDGKVACFMETGQGKGTILYFNYERPPKSPGPYRRWHWAKWAFNRAYWYTVPQGRV
ncbi:MAG: FAD/NAD(P)-binding oxidoreductase [Actinomycetota bacterium]